MSSVLRLGHCGRVVLMLFAVHALDNCFMPGHLLETKLYPSDCGLVSSLDIADHFSDVGFTYQSPADPLLTRLKRQKGLLLCGLMRYL